MKIVLCGSQGQLGWDCKRVFEKDYDVVALGRNELDITDPDNVNTVISDVRPAWVINCAAYTQVDQCETETDLAFAVNGEGPGYLAEACRASAAKLLHVSTDYVFDGIKEVPLHYTEVDTVNPISIYGQSKLEGEQRIAAVSDDHVIVRTSWLYGIGGNNFLKTMLKLSLNSPEKRLKVVNDQFGSPTWTLRLALQLERLIRMDGQGLYHATSEGYCSWFELAQHFLKLMEVPFNGEPCTSDEYPTPAKRPANSILENARLKQSDDNRMTGWRHGLEQFVSRYQQQLMDEMTGK